MNDSRYPFIRIEKRKDETTNSMAILLISITVGVSYPPN